MQQDEYEDISIEFTDEHDENKKFTARYFPNRQISTIAETYENTETGKIETTITKPGMNREELHRYFPNPTKKGTVNIEYLIRSIIYEAYIKEGLTGTIDGGNVRHFWYTHLKTVISGVLGNNNNSIKSSINRAWEYAINSGAVTYEEMDIISDSESGRLSIVKDSPFNNIIIAVEKQNFFDTFNWIPRLFNCTLITAGGQPSRAVARRFIYELKNDGVDLDQTFHMCIASDLDPAGYYIQDAFKNQFDLAIEYYGGTGRVKTHRLFVRKDQVTDELLNAQGIAWQPEKDKKSKETIWNYFCNKTDGGLYISKPDGWMGETEIIDGKEMVRALLEMDAFSTSIIEKSFVRELLKIIRETNDETKIMIPEIMRVFNETKDGISKNLFDRWNEKLIEPLKKEFMKDADEWKKFIENKQSTALDEINKNYRPLIDEKIQEKRDRVPELYDKKEYLEEQIQQLEEELSDVKDEIDEECEDIDDAINELKQEESKEKNQVYDDYHFRKKHYDDFLEEHIAVFNPVEQSLRNDIDKKLSDLDYRFRALEQRDEIKNEIASLSINSELLLKENISCFEHPAPAFYGENYLQKASLNKDLHIGNVRDSFPHKLLYSMKTIWYNDVRDLSFELSESVELKDLSQEVKTAMENTERALAEKNDTTGVDNSE
jgi:flagellar motility protein MotE (MotC chaperone)